MPGDGWLPQLSGSDALPDERLSDDVHVYCPTCAVHEPWVGRVIAAYDGLRAGLPLTEVAPDPTDALVEAVSLLAREADLRNAQQIKDRT